MAPSCKMCQKEYSLEERTPISLSCGHSFCRQCLTDLYNNTLILKCPTCIKTHTGPPVKDLPANLDFLSLSVTLVPDPEPPPPSPGTAQPMPKGSILFLLKTSTDMQIPIKIHQDTKLADLKLLLQIQYGLDAQSGFFKFQGKQLEDNKTLSECNVTSGAILHVDAVEDNLDVIKPLGKGGFGEVYLIKRNSRHLVLKRVDLRDLNDKARSLSVQEMKLLEGLNHPNIVSYEGGYRKNECLHIFMEFCAGGDLARHIEKKKEDGGFFPEEQVLAWTLKITEGLAYIHDRKIIHRDIKPANIFLSGTGTIKIGDFGICRVLGDNTSRGSTMIGTAKYTAIEVMNNEGFTTKADMFSLGCTVYETAALKTNYPYVMIPLPEGFSEDFKSLVQKLLEHSPDNRPDAPEVIRLPIFKKIATGHVITPVKSDQEEEYHQSHLRANTETQRTMDSLRRSIEEQNTTEIPEEKEEEEEGEEEEDVTLVLSEDKRLSRQLEEKAEDEATLVDLGEAVKELTIKPRASPIPLPRKKKAAPPIPPRPVSRGPTVEASLGILNQFCKEYEEGKNPDQKRGMEDIIIAMDAHRYNRIVQMQGCLALSYITMCTERQVLTSTTRGQIVDVLIRALENYPKDWDIRASSCQTLCQFAKPLDLLLRTRQLVPQLLRLIQENLRRKYSWSCLYALHLLHLMSSRVGEEYRVILVHFGTMEILSSLIAYGRDLRYYNEMYKFCWYIICNLTDETQINCDRFVKHHGLALILNCLSTYPQQQQQDRGVWFTLSNLAEVRPLRRSLQACPGLIETLLRHLDPSSGEVSWESAKILVHILSDGEAAWGLGTPRPLVIQKIEEAMAKWDLDSEPNSIFKTLRPFWILLSAYHTPVCQHWAAWTLARLTRVYREKYCPLIAEEGGLAHLQKLIDSVSKMPRKPRLLKKVSHSNPSFSTLLLTMQIKNTFEDFMAFGNKNRDLLMKLYVASSEGNLATVEELIKTGVDINALSSMSGYIGRSAIHLATFSGRTDVLVALLDAGASVDNPDGEGMTALHTATWIGRLDLVNILLIYGANLDAKTALKGWKVSHFASAGGHVQILEFLSEKCDLGEVTKDGKTLLHLAAEYGRESTVRWLLSKGLNVHYKDNFACEALDYASKKGFTSIVNTLKDRK